MPTNSENKVPLLKTTLLVFRWVKKYFNGIWFLCLLVCGAGYLHQNWNRVLSSPTTVDFIVIGAVFILAFFPLVSEVGIMGISVKRDIKSAKDEIKNTLLQLNEQIIDLRISSSSNSTASVYMTQQPLPTPEMMKRMTAEEEIRLNNEPPKPVEAIDVPESNAFLFKARYVLEEKIKQVYDVYYLPLPSHPNMRTMIDALINQGFITNSLYNLMKSIGSICNRGMHGEVVSDDYVVFVRKNLDRVMQELNDLIYNGESRGIFNRV